MDRTILHCDCNGFFASVECKLNPELKKVPMAVGGDSATRHGIILAKNELAKKYNIKTAETIGEAKIKCPQLVIVPPQHHIYEEFSEKVNNIYREYTDLAEKFGIDETWLDVTGSKKLFGSGVEIADTLRKRVKNEVGISISVGVSFNKVFAKLGSDYKKPDATTCITRKNYKEIVHPLPVEALLFVGNKTAQILNKMYIYTIGDLAKSDPKVLSKKLGKVGEMLYIYANGEENEPVKSIYEETEVKSVGKGKTFPYNLTDINEIKREIYELSDNIAMRLRQIDKRCGTIHLQIKNKDFKVVSKQKPLKNISFVTDMIAKNAIELFFELKGEEMQVRALTITATNLTDDEPNVQMSFFNSEDSNIKKLENLENTVDKIRENFGSKIITRGSGIDKLQKYYK